MAILPPDPRFLLHGDMECVHSALFKTNSSVEHVFAGTLHGNVHVWDLKTSRECTRIKSGEDSCLSLRSTKEDNLLVQQKRGLINAYKATECSWILENSFDTDFCHYCRFHPLSVNELLVPLKDSIVGIFSLKTFEVEAKLDATSIPSPKKLGEPTVIKPIKNEKHLVLVGYEVGELLLWDYKERKVVSRLEIEAQPMALDFDVSLMRGVVGGPSERLEVFNLLANDALTRKTQLTLRNPGVCVVSIRDDAKILATGGWDNRARIFSWKNLRPLAVLDIHKGMVQDVVFSAKNVEAYDDKCLMATAGQDGYVALWDIYN